MKNSSQVDEAEESMHLKKIIYGVLLACVVFIFIMYLLFSNLIETLVIKKNSFNYFAYIPPKVRELPVEQWGKVIHYHYNSGDGTTSLMVGVVFAVKQEPDKIIEAIENYFLEKKFRVIKKEIQSVDLKKDNQYVSVYHHYDKKIRVYRFEIMFIN